MMTRLLLLAIVVSATAVPVHGYSHFGTGVGTVRLHWATMPVRWFATNRGAPGVSSTEFRTTVERAFKTWEDVPTASMQFVSSGLTLVEPDEDDNLSVLGFQSHPEMDRVLAATSFDFDDATGELMEADIFFNSFFDWSTAVGGDATRFDLESVAVHEIGHLLGLGHSAIGETELRPEGGRRVLGSGAVMFPISIGRGSIADRVLQPDDIAGISDLYPEGNFEDTTGGVHGLVRRGTAAVVGAHVVVFNLRTRALVGGFSLGDQGEFQVLGLAPGPYVVRAEPLDDADIDSFFDLDSLDIDFQVTYYPRLVVAPSGGVGDSVTVTVRPK
jgi:matrixin